jgi:phosphatidylserine/phosphatidylglycerophosphate/cardiolipin synthase-like enzyme
MYLFTSTDVSDALVAAKKRGLDVMVILNQSFPQGGNANTTAYNALTKGKVPVVYAPSAFTFTHEKAVIVDGAHAWIMTMNVTKTSATENREFLAIDDDADDIAEVEAIFQADYANKSFLPSGKLVVAPVNARERLLELISAATSTVDLEGEALSDPQITNALAAKAKVGVAVRIVLADGSTNPAQDTAIATAKQAGAKVVIQKTPYIHSKAIVVDGARAYVGSANFTAGSLSYNREIGLIVDNTAEVAKVASTIATDFSTGTPQ